MAALQEIPFNGKSMDPLFKEATHVLVDIFEQPTKLKTGVRNRGDIVMYQEKNGEWVCHRLIDVDDSIVWLKGDNNTTMDMQREPAVWGCVKGFVKDKTAYEIKSFIAMPLICYFQKKQCESSSYWAQKSYRSASFLLLFFHKIFSTRKRNQFIS